MVRTALLVVVAFVILVALYVPAATAPVSGSVQKIAQTAETACSD